MRKRRKGELEEHLTQKPGENDDDIRDNKAIKLAEKTVGDYKLKVAEDYEITEECRINATKKKSQVCGQCYDVLCYTMQCCPMLCCAMLCCLVLRCSMLRYSSPLLSLLSPLLPSS